MTKNYTCSASGKPIPESRVEALRILGIPEEQWTCVEHGGTQRKRGIYFGNHGSGQLVIANYVDNETLVKEEETLAKLEEA
jgi:hypothetical protein